jgi:2-polyprenyl-3-methyl-5-hydroxy-6-metoxy-1,4-benzoquinol methylase
MRVRQKVKNVLRGMLQTWGTPEVKRSLWNKEFSEGRWDFIDNTPGDPVYGYIEKYCRNGSILDLGCGSGNTGNELAVGSYQRYTGVDVSDVAVEKAMRRTARNGRSQKNSYFQSDISSFTPKHEYDVTLFRECIFYIPRIKLGAILDKYAKYLKPDGVFVVRMEDRYAYADIVDLVEKNYRILERYVPSACKTIVMVFR